MYLLIISCLLYIDIALSNTLFVVADIPNHSLYAVILLSYRIQIYISRFDFLLDPFCIFILLYMFFLIIVLKLSVYTNKILFIPRTN